MEVRGFDLDEVRMLLGMARDDDTPDDHQASDLYKSVSDFLEARG